MWPWPRRSRTLGQQGEDIVAWWLRWRRFRILGRNVQLGRYEIDIIARKGDTVVFVEVKTRRDDTVASPEENVTATKRRHIRAAAHTYIAAQGDSHCYYRFDIASVVVPERGKPVVTYYPDAFRDE